VASHDLADINPIETIRRNAMERKVMKQCFGAFAVLFFMSTSLLHSEDLVTGRWECSGDGVNGEAVQYLLDLKQSGEQVTGTITYGSDAVDIAQGSIQGNKLEITVVTDDNHYMSTGIVDNGKITGTWKDDKGTTGKWQAKRQ
jgi:hypothetical protein